MPRLSPLARFVLTALAVYAAWFVVYDLWLLPDGRLDRAVALGAAVVARGSLGVAGADVWGAGRVVGLAGGDGVQVADGCNGLSTTGLFVGFVVAFPGPWRSRAWFLPSGIAVLFVVNAVRVAVLAGLQVGAPGWFDATHTFLATSVFYVVVFGLWLAWSKLGERAALRPPRQGPVPA